MAITDKKKGVWGLDQTYNKINQGSIWNYQVGTMWAWGYNQYGQLGQNDRTHRSSPVQIGSDANWIDIHNSPYGFFSVANVYAVPTKLPPAPD